MAAVSANEAVLITAQFIPVAHASTSEMKNYGINNCKIKIQ
jgi:hypothetical protein